MCRNQLFAMTSQRSGLQWIVFEVAYYHFVIQTIAASIREIGKCPKIYSRICCIAWSGDHNRQRRVAIFCYYSGWIVETKRPSCHGLLTNYVFALIALPRDKCVCPSKGMCGYSLNETGIYKSLMTSLGIIGSEKDGLHRHSEWILII